MRFTFTNTPFQFMLAEASRDLRKPIATVWFAPELRRVERVSVGDGQAVAALYQSSLAIPGGMMDLAYLVVERDGSHTVYEVPSSDCGCIQVPGATWTEQELLAALGESPVQEPDPEPEREPEREVSAVKLLLTDGEGWAGLYGEADAAKLGEVMRHADLAGEPLFTRAYLILPSGVVVPTKAQGQMTPFDDEDYASASITFTPDPEWPAKLDSAVARSAAVEVVGAGWTFSVSWRVDGRS